MNNINFPLLYLLYCLTPETEGYFPMDIKSKHILHSNICFC